LSERGLAEAYLQSNLQSLLKTISTDVRNGSTISYLGNKKIEITDKDGNVIKWEFDNNTKKIKRNDSQIGTLGSDKADFKCEFTEINSQIISLNLKIVIKTNTGYEATTGTDFVEFRFNCRNVSYEET